MTLELPGRDRFDGVLLAAAAACAGALASSAPFESCAGVAVVLAAMVLRLRVARAQVRAGARAAVVAVAAAAFVLARARASAAIRSFETARAHTLAAGPWPARCSVAGPIVRSPVMSGDAMKMDVDVVSSSCPVRGVVTLHVPRAIALPFARGDELLALAQLAPAHRFWNPDTGDPRPAQARRRALLSGGVDDVVVRAAGHGVAAWIDHFRHRLRERILATFPSRAAPMARALVLGEDDLAKEDQRAFRRSGLAHLLAVSGMHLVLVVVSIVAAMRAVLARIPFVAMRVAPLRLASAAGVPLAWLYADLAGGSGSAVRAAWMTSVGLVAHALSRRPDAWRALGLSMIVMVLVDPLAPYDLSFVLSAAATAGILAIAPRVLALAARIDGRPQGLGEGSPHVAARVVTAAARAAAASLGASIACAPILAGMTAELPLVGLVANLVAVPIGEAAALPLCLVHALLGPWPIAERGCALAASGALWLVDRVAHVASGPAWSTLRVPSPTPAQLAVIGVAAMAMSPAVTSPRTRRAALAVLAVLFGVLEVEVRARGAPTGVLRATFLDVGQGDAALVDLPDGRAILVDGGGFVGSPIDTGERVIGPVLRARRRTSLAAVVLSHPHPDHFGGLRSGLEGVRPGVLWDTGQGEAEGLGGEYEALLAALRSRGVPVRRPHELCGVHDLGRGAFLDVLAPCPAPDGDRGPNDNSFVLRIRYGARAVLFVGDAERVEEADLVGADAARLRADVLKVGHHGSRTSSSPAFLAAVDPAVAIVSCGVRNRFGHPAPSTLLALASTRAEIRRTDHDGAVTVMTDGTTLEVTTASRP